MEALFPLVITFGLMWVLLIRPQQRRVRQHQAVVASLVVGDEVVTTGGLIGTVEAINDDVVTIEVAPGVSIRLLRSAVQNRIGPGETGPDEYGEDRYGSDEYGADEYGSEEIEPDDVAEPPEIEVAPPATDEAPLPRPDFPRPDSPRPDAGGIA